MTVKLRKVGNSNTLTVPNSIKPSATKFDVFQGRDGIISFIPKEKNPFRDPEFIATHDLKQKEAFGGPLIGKENPES
ncbi:antitoxin of toxin-antitoxin stability system [Levilactobacillus hammesii]|uniref:SpoVT-AbrB domain-containing protein n=1 Tax=Levilactobacillus hammesii DSM 16381 TaxID=1423753 RepID=A0A0R1UJA4_9LACO|nr:hypothetical protein [Levilactobacillus hammesii]KRL93325.1 hypothetical protein FD28_GL001198 [Levilactobacillus hammesii DSM 16381]